MNSKNLNLMGNIFFIVGFIPYFIISFLNTSMYHLEIPVIFNKITLLWMIACFCLKIVGFDRLPVQELLFIFVCLVLMYFSETNASSSVLFAMTIAILASRNLNSRIFIFTYEVIGVLLLIFIMFSAKYNLIEDLTYLRGLTVRHAFGIVYPTDFAAHVFFLVAGYIFLRGKKYRLIEAVAFVLFAWLIYVETDARLNFGLILFVAIMGLFAKYFNRILQRILWLMPVGLFIIIFSGSIYYNPNSFILTILNKVLSGRLQLTNLIYGQHGIKLWGQLIYENGLGGLGSRVNRSIYGYYYVDSSYMRLILIYGLVATVIFLFILTLRLRGRFDARLSIILVAILMSGLIEQHIIEVAYNPFFIILAGQMMNKFDKKHTQIV